MRVGAIRDLTLPSKLTEISELFVWFQLLKEHYILGTSLVQSIQESRL